MTTSTATRTTARTSSPGLTPSISLTTAFSPRDIYNAVSRSEFNTAAYCEVGQRVALLAPARSDSMAPCVQNSGTAPGIQKRRRSNLPRLQYLRAREVPVPWRGDERLQLRQPERSGCHHEQHLVVRCHHLGRRYAAASGRRTHLVLTSPRPLRGRRLPSSAAFLLLARLRSHAFAMHSISTSASFGNAATCTVERAGATTPSPANARA